MTVAERHHIVSSHPVEGADGGPLPGWYCRRVYVGRSASGAPIHRCGNFRGPEKAALRKFIVEVEAVQGAPPDEPTVTQLLEPWMADTAHRASTQQGYRSKIDTYLGPAFCRGDRQKSDIGVGEG